MLSITASGPNLPLMRLVVTKRKYQNIYTFVPKTIQVVTEKKKNKKNNIIIYKVDEKNVSSSMDVPYMSNQNYCIAYECCKVYDHIPFIRCLINFTKFMVIIFCSTVL